MEAAPTLNYIFILYMEVFVEIFKCLAHSKHLKYYLRKW